MDKATTEDVANYTINNNVTVKAAKLSDDRDSVKLTTEGITKNKVYSEKLLMYNRLI